MQSTFGRSRQQQPQSDEHHYASVIQAAVRGFLRRQRSARRQRSVILIQSSLSLDFVVPNELNALMLLSHCRYSVQPPDSFLVLVTAWACRRITSLVYCWSCDLSRLIDTTDIMTRQNLSSSIGVDFVGPEGFEPPQYFGLGVLQPPSLNNSIIAYFPHCCHIMHFIAPQKQKDARAAWGSVGRFPDSRPRGGRFYPLGASIITTFMLKVDEKTSLPSIFSTSLRLYTASNSSNPFIVSCTTKHGPTDGLRTQTCTVSYDVV